MIGDTSLVRHDGTLGGSGFVEIDSVAVHLAGHHNVPANLVGECGVALRHNAGRFEDNFRGLRREFFTDKRLSCGTGLKTDVGSNQQDHERGHDAILRFKIYSTLASAERGQQTFG